MAPKRGKPRILAFALVIALATLAALALGYSSVGRQMNQYASDAFFRLRGPEQQGVSGITIVAIDDAALRRFGNPPLDRAILAQAIERVCRAKPSVIGLDFVFSAPSKPEADRALAAVLAACPQTVLVANLTAKDVASLEATDWDEPLPEFARYAGGIGHAHAEPDLDGVCRQVLLAKSAGRVRHWALALEMLRVARGAPTVCEPDERTLVIGNQVIPAERESTAGSSGARNQQPLLINYAGLEGAFPRYSFADVFDGRVPPERLTGRAVLFGVTAQAGGDRKFTPFSTEGLDMAGVEIHANALRTLATGRALHLAPDSSALAGVLLIVLLVALPLFRLRGIALAAVLLALAALVHLVPYLLFRQRQIMAPAFSFSLAFWAPLLVGGVFQYRTVWRRYREADESNWRLRRGLDFVAHEIRSPLTAIQGSGEVISRYPLNDERRKQLGDLVSRESQRVASMVARFLDVERLESGEMELRRGPVEVLRVVEGAIQRAEPLSRRKQIEVRLLPSQPAQTSGDAELLEFAVYNLVSNAIKYSPEGSAVELRVAADPAAGNACVEVKDQGEGISREDQGKIFERFYRTAGVERSSQPGLGLGLSIVREIARHHQGSVRLESAPGLGSKFSLVLPLAAGRASAAP